MKVHLVAKGTMPTTPLKTQTDPKSAYPKEVLRRLRRQRRAVICWNSKASAY